MAISNQFRQTSHSSAVSPIPETTTRSESLISRPNGPGDGIAAGPSGPGPWYLGECLSDPVEGERRDREGYPQMPVVAPEGLAETLCLLPMLSTHLSFAETATEMSLSRHTMTLPKFGFHAICVMNSSRACDAMVLDGKWRSMSQTARLSAGNLDDRLASWMR